MFNFNQRKEMTATNALIAGVLNLALKMAEKAGVDKEEALTIVNDMGNSALNLAHLNVNKANGLLSMARTPEDQADALALRQKALENVKQIESVLEKDTPSQ